MTHASGDPFTSHHERGSAYPPCHTQLGTCLLSTGCLKPPPSFFESIFPAYPQSSARYILIPSSESIVLFGSRRSYIIVLHRYDIIISRIRLTSDKSEPSRLHISSYHSPRFNRRSISTNGPSFHHYPPLPARAERLAGFINHHELLQRLLSGLRQTDKRHSLLLADLQVVGDSPSIRTSITSIHRLEVCTTALHGTNTNPHRTPARHRLLIIPAVSPHNIISKVQHAHAFAQQVTLTNLPNLDWDKPVTVRQQAVRASPQRSEQLRRLL